MHGHRYKISAQQFSSPTCAFLSPLFKPPQNSRRCKITISTTHPSLTFDVAPPEHVPEPITPSAEIPEASTLPTQVRTDEKPIYTVDGEGDCFDAEGDHLSRDPKPKLKAGDRVRVQVSPGVWETGVIEASFRSATPTESPASEESDVALAKGVIQEDRDADLSQSVNRKLKLEHLPQKLDHEVAEELASATKTLMHHFDDMDDTKAGESAAAIVQCWMWGIDCDSPADPELQSFDSISAIEKLVLRHKEEREL